MINTMKRVALICCLLQPAVLLAEENASDDAATETNIEAALPCMGTTKVDIADKSLTVELAKDLRARRLGLMFREGLGADCGMLYLFKDTQRRMFSMRNTAMPLDIAFISPTGIISELATMEIGNSNYQSAAEVMYVLEVNAGWFEENNLQPGSRMSFKMDDAMQPLSSLVNY